MRHRLHWDLLYTIKHKSCPDSDREIMWIIRRYLHLSRQGLAACWCAICREWLKTRHYRVGSRAIQSPQLIAMMRGNGQQLLTRANDSCRTDCSLGPKAIWLLNVDYAAGAFHEIEIPVY